MTKRARSFHQTEADAIIRDIAAIRDETRASIVANAGATVDADTIRVTAREMQGAVRNRLLDTVPAGNDLAALVAREPEWLHIDLSDGGFTTPHDAIREEIVSAVTRRVATSILSVVAAEFEGVDLPFVIEACREAAAAAREIDTDEARTASTALLECCDKVEAQDSPYCFELVSPMYDTFQELKLAGKDGDVAKLVPARRLMELLEHVNTNFTQLDRTAAAAPSRPRP